MDISRPELGSTRYLTPSPVLRSLRLFPLGAGRTAGRVPLVRPRRLACHGVILVTEGVGEFRCRTTVPVVGPALVWLFPGVEHSYGPSAAGWTENWLLFDGASTGPYRDLGLLDPLRPVQSLHTPESSRAGDLVAEAVDLVLSDDARRLTQVTGLLHLLISRYSPGRPAGAEDSLVRDLRAHAFESTSVPAHAERLAISVPHLRAAVREHTGMSPKEYLVGLRVERAQLLLAQTDRTVGAIAREVGYDDPGYFTRIFTARTGTSPSTFRVRYSTDRGRPADDVNR